MAVQRMRQIPLELRFQLESGYVVTRRSIVCFSDDPDRPFPILPYDRITIGLRTYQLAVPMVRPSDFPPGARADVTFVEGEALMLVSTRDEPEPRHESEPGHMVRSLVGSGDYRMPA